MIHTTDESYWRDLEAKADLPEVQEIIRQEIQIGTIRVRPKPGGGICIVPVSVPEYEEIEKAEALPDPLQGEPRQPGDWPSEVASHAARSPLTQRVFRRRHRKRGIP